MKPLIQVILETLEEKNKYFFKNILFFTSDENHSSIKYLKDSIKKFNVKLYLFNINNLIYVKDQNKIIIKDNNQEYKINKNTSNLDSIVFTRFGRFFDNEYYIELIKELEKFGFLVINNIDNAEIANNKYKLALKLKEYNLPQPRFCLIEYNDIKDHKEDNNKQLYSKLRNIYPDAGKNAKKDKEYEYVIKLLSGSGGIGVTITNGLNILSELQTIFALDENSKVLVQRKEENEGDIRVHVITLNSHQVILGAILRKKRNNDFRSNQKGENIKYNLNAEQKELVLKVAKISGLTWCAIDLMPVKNNIDNYSNVIIEYNASPGTEDASKVLGFNLFDKILDNINDINDLPLIKYPIGYEQNVKIKLKNEFINFTAKFDTGNGTYASTIGCDEVNISSDKIKAKIKNKTYTFDRHGQVNAIVGQSHETRNTVIIPEIIIGSRHLKDVEFALVDNRSKSTEILINRETMNKLGIIVDPSINYELNNKKDIQINKEDF